MQKARLNGNDTLERFRSKTPTSKKLFERAAKVTPGGVSAAIKFFEPYPVYMRRASGSRIWDVDGNEYVDYLMSYGAIVLGHGHPAVKKAIESVVETVGTTVRGTPSELEVEYGSMLRDIYHRDGMIRFTNSGLEATLLAVRLARAFTGRRKVAKFEGHYHGAVDQLLFSYTPRVDRAGGDRSPEPVPDSADVDEGMVSRSLVLPFNDWDATEARLTEKAKDVACVILEPFEEGVIPGDRSFMAGLRKLTRDLKIPLVYDEVKTGFRVRVGGASEYYGVTPDLTCLGKIIGGGVPIGAVVGDEVIMSQLDPRGGRDRLVFHSGTFNGNPLSLSVGRATVEELMGKGRFETLVRRTEGLKRSVSATLSEHRVSHVVLGEGGMFNYYLTDRPVKNYRDAMRSDLSRRRLIDLEMIGRGVYLKPQNRFCLSLAHTEDDNKLAAQRLDESLQILA